MKRLFVFCFAVLSATSSFAQGKVQEQSFEYTRSSVSSIALVGAAPSYQSTLLGSASARNYDGKFDMNEIPLKSISVSADTAAILSKLNAENVGKQALDYWLLYDGKTFNASRFEERGEYNASDADVLEAGAAKVDAIKQRGKDLIKNTYFIVSGPTEDVKALKNKKGETVGYGCKAAAYVYKANIDAQLISEIYENWMDSDMSASELAKAKNFYDNLQIPVSFVAMCEYDVDDETPEKAAAAAFISDVSPLEGKIDAWQVVTSIFKLHPIGAKIGTKEGLRNSDRYRAYKVTEDADGNIVYKNVGYARATKVVNNSHVATGQSECSNFYQISGGRFREGMFLKQKKDLQLGVSAMYNVGDALSSVRLDFDYLLHTSQFMGCMTYVMLSAGYDSPEMDSHYDDYSLMYIPVSLGLGYGIHPIRQVEIMPYVMGGADFVTLSGDYETDDDAFMEKIRYTAGGGVKVGWNVWYPVQLFVKADYTSFIGDGGLYYEAVGSLLKEKRETGLSLQFGVRVGF